MTYGPASKVLATLCQGPVNQLGASGAVTVRGAHGSTKQCRCAVCWLHGEQIPVLAATSGHKRANGRRQSLKPTLIRINSNVNTHHRIVLAATSGLPRCCEVTGGAIAHAYIPTHAAGRSCKSQSHLRRMIHNGLDMHTAASRAMLYCWLCVEVFVCECEESIASSLLGTVRRSEPPPSKAYRLTLL